MTIPVRFTEAGHAHYMEETTMATNIVKQTTFLADSGINIVDMLNRSRGELAHNIIDCENGVPAEVLTRISNIEGVIMTRLIEMK